MQEVNKNERREKSRGDGCEKEGGNDVALELKSVHVRTERWQKWLRVRSKERIHEV